LSLSLVRYPDRTAVPDSGDPLPLEKARQQRRPQRTADMMVPLGPIQTRAGKRSSQAA